jgi:hypothetical protein
MEGARREEAFCCFEVARAQQKAQLVGWGAKLTREATQFGWEIKILFALDTVENRRRFKGLAFHRIEDVHPGHDGSPIETAHLTRCAGECRVFSAGVAGNGLRRAEEVNPAPHG